MSSCAFLFANERGECCSPHKHPTTYKTTICSRQNKTLKPARRAPGHDLDTAAIDWPSVVSLRRVLSFLCLGVWVGALENNNRVFLAEAGPNNESDASGQEEAEAAANGAAR